MIVKFWETMQEEYPTQMEKFKQYLHKYYTENGLEDFTPEDSYQTYLKAPMEQQLGIFIMFEDAQVPPPKNSLMITFQGLVQADFQIWEAVEKAKKEINTTGLKVVKGEDKGLFGLMEAPPEKPFMPCEKCEDAINCTFAQKCLFSSTDKQGSHFA